MTSSRDFHIVVIGSSTAAGTGASTPDSAWVNRYRQHLRQQYPDRNIRVTNLALGGYATYQLLPDSAGPFRARPVVDKQRNISQALRLQPDAVIVNLPSNDTASGHSAKEQSENFDRIVAAAVREGVFIWILTSQPRNFEPEKIAVQKVVRDSILAKYGPFSVDVWQVLADSVDRLSQEVDAGDGTHLNDEGHARILAQVQGKNIPDTVLQFRKAGELASAVLTIPGVIGGQSLSWAGRLIQTFRTWLKP